LSAVLRGKAPRPLSFAYLGQGIALGRHNAIGFNNYPDDKPFPPYFTGWLGYLIREGFVRLLATAVQHGAIVWPGKGRYEHAQRRQQAIARKIRCNSIEYDEGVQGYSESAYPWRSPGDLYTLGRARSNQEFYEGG
jgi:hypothetical protein